MSRERVLWHCRDSHSNLIARPDTGDIPLVDAELDLERIRPTNDSEQIDHRTSRSICDAIGARLQLSLRPDTSRLSSHLQHLMDELRRRDSEGRWRSN